MIAAMAASCLALALAFVGFSPNARGFTVISENAMHACCASLFAHASPLATQKRWMLAARSAIEAQSAE